MNTNEIPRPHRLGLIALAMAAACCWGCGADGRMYSLKADSAEAALIEESADAGLTEQDVSDDEGDAESQGTEESPDDDATGVNCDRSTAD